ncbi:MAG TPA: HAD family hydrolase [Syntrophales bacterium]|nr:HAD family hydrolase [Syntrophales bacterium]HPC01925.1 HAD family hydrolase [Syntrophales bacterium]HRS87124.1 HAD family hydrolase [Syntrophales bacterium]HRV42773.1 HAD family hydrolase [Syntrophales bacterium]
MAELGSKALFDGRTPRAVFFDFDGTLAVLNIDFPAMRRTVIEILHRYGVLREALTAPYVLEMIAEGTRVIAARDQEKARLFHGEAFEAVREIELEAAAKGELLPGARGVLTALRLKGVKTAVLTRNCTAAVERVFPDVRDLLDVVITRDDTPLVKPDPYHLRRAMAALGCGASRGVMVGDHPMDITMGRRVGLKTVGVLSGTADEGQLREAGAEAVIADLRDLLPLVSIDHESTAKGFDDRNRLW